MKELYQYAVLTKHFFRRFFQNEIFSFEEVVIEKLVAILSLIAVLSGVLSYQLVSLYLFWPDRGTSWVKKAHFVAFSMIVMGIVAVLEWSEVFPDRRDFSNLLHLPVKARTLVASKLTAVFLLSGLFSVSVNLFALPTFAFHLAQWHSKSLLYLLQFSVAHFASLFSSNLFVLFFLISLEGLLFLLLPKGLFKALSGPVQFILIAGFVASYTMLPSFSQKLKIWAQQSPELLFRLPPLWFTGLYETLAGHKTPLFLKLANYALVGLSASFLASIFLFNLSFSRGVFRLAEGERSSGRPPLLLSAENFLSRFLIKKPVERAVFGFFRIALSRSSRHRLMIAAYLAVPAGILLVKGVALLQQGKYVLPFLLAASHVLFFFANIGARRAAEIPVAPEANWIFKLTETRQKADYLNAVKKAVFLLLLFPIAALIFLVVNFFLPWHQALFHSLFSLAAAALFMKALFLNFRSIPFAACSAERPRIHKLWAIFIFGLFLYVALLTLMELFVFKYLFAGMSLAVLLLFAAYIVMDKKERLKLKELEAFLYEEEPEQVMLSFKL